MSDVIDDLGEPPVNDEDDITSSLTGISQLMCCPNFTSLATDLSAGYFTKRTIGTEKVHDFMR